MDCVRPLDSEPIVILRDLFQDPSSRSRGELIFVIQSHAETILPAPALPTIRGSGQLLGDAMRWRKTKWPTQLSRSSLDHTIRLHRYARIEYMVMSEPYVIASTSAWPNVGQWLCALESSNLRAIDKVRSLAASQPCVSVRVITHFSSHDSFCSVPGSVSHPSITHAEKGNDCPKRKLDLSTTFIVV